MSTIAVNAITDANGGSTTSINGTTPNAYNTVGKNLIINGNMRIDQRNNGSAVTSASNVYLTDRWQLQIFGTTNTPSFQQVTDAPTGFQYSLKATSNGSETISASDAVTPRQRIEGLNSAHLLYGSANAKTITVSFWVKSSLTGTWNVAINNSAFDRSYVAEYTISSANTWEYKTVTISGDTSGTWNTDNTTGIVVMFPVDAGTDLDGTANTWLSGSYRTTSGSNRLLQTSGATWQVTGVQLEVGDTATLFEHRPYDMELARCQRYYQLHDGMVAANGNESTSVYPAISFKTEMRATPSLSQSGVINFVRPSVAVYNQSSISVNLSSGSSTGARLRLLNFSGLTTNQIYIQHNSGAYVTLDAEL